MWLGLDRFLVADEVLPDREKTFNEVLEDSRRSSEFIAPFDFCEVFGDLTECNYAEDLDLSATHFKTLKGMPHIVSGCLIIAFCPKLTSLEGISSTAYGDICICDNERLNSLEFFPETMSANCIVDIQNMNLKSLDGLDPEILRDCSEIYLYNLGDVSVGEIMIKCILYREKNGSFEGVNADYGTEVLESLYRACQTLDKSSKNLIETLNKVAELVD